MTVLVLYLAAGAYTAYWMDRYTWVGGVADPLARWAVLAFTVVLWWLAVVIYVLAPQQPAVRSDHDDDL